MAPADLVAILAQIVLRIVNDEVGPGEELDVAEILPVRQGRAATALGGPRRVRLVVGGIDHGDTTHLQAIAEREGGVIQILGDDSHFSRREAPLDEVVVANGRPELAERHGKVRVLHLPGKGPLELQAESARSVDVPLVVAAEERREEREPLYVIPVGMGDQQVPTHRRTTPDQRLPEAVGPGAAIEHDERARGSAHLDARGVAAIAERVRPRLGQ